MSHVKAVSSLTALLLFTLFAAPLTFAQTSVEVKADATLNIRPLELIKARALQIKESAQNAKIELRADTKAKLQTASSSGEKRDVLKDAMDTRNENARDRTASTTQIMRGLKALVLMHGGEIKNRFRLAINQMHNLLARVETRLGKMAADGIDTTSVTKLKVDAELAIDKAEVDANAVANFIVTVDDSSDRQAIKAELQTKMKTAQDSVKAAHEAVLKVVHALVALAKDTKVNSNASTTIETTIQ